jgi:vesicle-fusing ATPase
LTVTKSEMMQTGASAALIETDGRLIPMTEVRYSVKPGDKLRLKNDQSGGQSLFRPDFKIADMGIGGLDDELTNIFRRAFASRRFPQAVVQKFGIKHIKGILLYGPPGTGKTLIARQLAKVLKAK